MLTTAEIKTYLQITSTDYDALIDLYNPICFDRVMSYLRRSNYELPIGYNQIYSKYVLLTAFEANDKKGSGNVKSKSFDGQSITYGDTTINDIAKTSGEQLKKFAPLRKPYYV